AIDEVVERYRNALVRRWDIEQPALAIAQRVLDPALDHLTDHERAEVSTLIVAPDGLLNLVPFEAFGHQGGYLVERYAVRYVTTGRDLLPPVVPADALRTRRRQVVVIGSPTGAELPGVRREVDAINDTFDDVVMALGDQATEGRMHELERPWIVHVATHGAFDTGRPGSRYHELAIPPEPGRPGGVPRASTAWHTFDDPMFHSYLELSPEPVESSVFDGRLTAYEVSGLDLRGTQLVVLSGCETGLGMIEVGEGVLGLRRALSVAGAETLLMSLWRISDDNAANLLGPYYQRLARGQGRGEALRARQLELLRSREFEHPHHWAQFIVLGETTPLDLGDGADSNAGAEHPPPQPRPRGCALEPAQGQLAGWCWLLILLRPGRASRVRVVHGRRTDRRTAATHPRPHQRDDSLCRARAERSAAAGRLGRAAHRAPSVLVTHVAHEPRRQRPGVGDVVVPLE
ncbi:MAG: CHAT domain-containing protein, partial [Deltaproteobacteria bacterium]|nr:CHAT domain-containing protein [Deltaproteobacteria bacterium]